MCLVDIPDACHTFHIPVKDVEESLARIHVNPCNTNKCCKNVRLVKKEVGAMATIKGVLQDWEQNRKQVLSWLCSKAHIGIVKYLKWRLDGKYALKPPLGWHPDFGHPKYNKKIAYFFKYWFWRVESYLWELHGEELRTSWKRALQYE